MNGEKDIRDYLEQRFAEFEKRITLQIGHIADKLQDALGPVRNDVERLRGSISELYDMDRTQAAEISEVRARVGQLEQGQKDKDRGASRTIAILGIIIAAMGIAAGFLI